MAVGMMTPSEAPNEFVLYVSGSDSTQMQSKKSRVTLVAGALVMCMCVGVAMVSMGGQKPVEMMAGGADVALAVGLLRSAPTASVSELKQQLDRYMTERINSLDQSEGAQMLSMYPEKITQALADSGAMCAKKDVIIAKLDQLLGKLVSTGEALNATDADLEKKKNEALAAWLDGEAGYRLAQEKVKEAEEGAHFARASFEKWSETVKNTQTRLAEMQKEYNDEAPDIQSEKTLILEIMRFLGIVDEQPLTDQGAAAGGRAAQAVTPQTLQEVQSQIEQLEDKATNLGGKQAQEVKLLTSKLASYAETREIKVILQNMMKDLDSRLSVISATLKETQAELEQHTAKKQEYEKMLVDLSNAEDKAKQQADKASLARQSLNGEQKVAAEAYHDEHQDYAITSPPNEREIFIIKLVKFKIAEFCATATGPAAAPAAAP